MDDKTYRVEIDKRAWDEIMRLTETIQNAVFDKTYRVEIDKRAWDEIMRLTETIQNAVFDAIESLEHDSRPAGCVKLKGEEGIYQIRTGNYRIAYNVHDEVLTVLVVKVGHRSEVYKKKK